MTIQGRGVVGLLVYVFMDDEGRQLDTSKNPVVTGGRGLVLG
jgi:hypothetical protein